MSYLLSLSPISSLNPGYWSSFVKLIISSGTPNGSLSPPAYLLCPFARSDTSSHIYPPHLPSLSSLSSPKFLLGDLRTRHDQHAAFDFEDVGVPKFSFFWLEGLVEVGGDHVLNAY